MKKRILLRDFKKSDAPAIFKWANDPDITKFTGKPLTKTAEQEYNRLLHKIKFESREVFMIETTDQKKSIGHMYLDLDKNNQKTELSITVGEKDYWGKGYGSEAVNLFLDYCFNKLHLNKVCLKVLSFNNPAIKMYKKAGFRKEGILREDIFLNGKYEDFIVMSILRREYV